jgi:hypothetical protein
MSSSTTPDNILLTAHSVLASFGVPALAEPGVYTPPPGAPLRPNEFFRKIARPLVAPEVDRDLTMLMGYILPDLAAAGFSVTETPVFKRMLGASFAIREARVLLTDPAMPGTEPTLAVTVRLVARCDQHYDLNASDLVLDVVARRTGGAPGDLKAQRPFLRVVLAGVRVDWGRLVDQSFSEVLPIAMAQACGTGKADGSFGAGAREFTTKLVDLLAP